jgi:excisionase family DNA binding protein
VTTAAPEALTVPEVMAALRISRPKVYDLIRSRALVSFTIGRARRIPAEALTTYIRTRITEEQES